ncbi:flagellar filament capping protein FliD [Caproiciproducens galactitolivorans]|uniref:Filament cap protein n=1 Tax=Caproiciproducens galactitolivorans TaxID=642589 RepID=A0A4Z0YEK4_9FIRM|nr:flagellar filament capping protein FliD [Caproiciproducens galactitolivorans]TGJ76186.1 flagellar hook-associated protein 2 [Caproiciproducens galactitolivorans]
MIVSKSNSSSSATTTSSNKRLSGLVSGLDTDELVKQLSSGTQSKIDKQLQNKQIAQWRQESYREVIKALSEFQAKYLSTTTSSSILNRNFFTSTSIKNSSTFLNVTGSATAAKNMLVTQITQLAQQASFTSMHKVSKQAIKTGSISASWLPSNVAGNTMVINYDGKDYQLTLDSTLTFNPGDDVSKITDALNDAIAGTNELAGNVSFSVDADGKVTLTKTGSATGNITIKDGTATLLAGLGLEKNSSAATQITGSTAPDTDFFFQNTLTTGSTLNIKIGSTDYTLTIPKDTKIPSDSATAANTLQEVLKEAIQKNTDSSGTATDLKDKLDVTVSEDGTVSFFTKDGVSENLSITGGSQNLLEGLGLRSGDTISTSGTVDRTKLVSKYLGDTLAGSTLTFSLDGVKKYITFDISDLNSADNDYSTPEKLQAYLQKKLTAEFGTAKDADGNTVSKVQVSIDSGSLSFSTYKDSKQNGIAVSTSVLSLETCDKSGILGINGALKVYAGETNRINTNKTLEDIQADLSTSLTASDDGTYGIIINDQKFTFKKTDTIDTIIKTINSDTHANVNISYSSVNDSFTITAKSGGSSSRVDVQNIDGKCNLANVLFGTVPTKDADGNYIENSSAYSLTKGQDAKMTVSFDGNANNAIEITRSENKFTLDGVDFELLGITDSTVSATNPIKFTVNSETDKLYEKIKDFVDDYNSIITLCTTKINERQSADDKYLPLTDAQKAEMTETQIKEYEKKAKVGILNSDSLLMNLCLNLRKAMTDQVDSVKSSLYEIGISTKANDYSGNGLLTIDEDKLKAALTNDPDKVASLFTDSNGVATKVQNVINDNIKTTGGDGLLVAKAGLENSTKYDNSTLTQEISSYTQKIKELKTRLKTEQDRYYAKFTKLEQYISRMNTQASMFFDYGTSS